MKPKSTLNRCLNGPKYRTTSEIVAEHGVKHDDATLNRWVVNYSPVIPSKARRQKSRFPRGAWIKHKLK